MDRRELAKKLIESKDGKIRCAVKEYVKNTQTIINIVGVDFHSDYRPFQDIYDGWWDEAEPIENNKCTSIVEEATEKLDKLQDSVDVLREHIGFIYDRLYTMSKEINK